MSRDDAARVRSVLGFSLLLQLWCPPPHQALCLPPLLRHVAPPAGIAIPCGGCCWPRLAVLAVYVIKHVLFELKALLCIYMCSRVCCSHGMDVQQMVRAARLEAGF